MRLFGSDLVKLWIRSAIEESSLFCEDKGRWREKGRRRHEVRSGKEEREGGERSEREE